MTVGPDIVWIAEVDTYLPGTTITATTPGHGVLPHGVLPVAVTAASGKLYVSDTGYRSASTDAQGVIPYPPVMQQGFALDLRINLDPGQSAAGAAWGEMILTNTDRRFDAIAATLNSDGRDVKIWLIDRYYDAARGYWWERGKDLTGPYMQCIAGPWRLGLDTLDIPLRDASYWLDKPIQSNLYDGSGTYGGTADLKGKPKPKARGGTNAAPIKNVTPVLVDPTNLIYQYSDARGTVVALYEGGDTNITFQADTANLYAGATTAGKYRTDNSRGLFQLGSVAQRQITCDVTGEFPAAGVRSGAGELAYYLLTEDAALPTSYVDSTALFDIDLTFNDTSGIYIGPDDAIDGIAAAASMLVGLGAGGKLFPKIDGTISAFVLAPPEGDATLGIPRQIPSILLTPANVVACEPRDLPAILYPPPYRFRVGSRRNWTIQTSGFAPTISATRQSTIANKFQVDLPSLAYTSAYRRPNDPPILETMLTHPTAGIQVADWHMAMWGVRRRLYDITIPRDLWFQSAPVNVGMVVQLTYPLDDLTNGRLGWIVGLQIRSQDPTITLQVLV